MEVQFGTPGMIESWMELVTLVSWNFPGLETREALEEHRETVLNFISRRQALCVRRGDQVVGVLLFSRKRNMICCLAVHPNFRRQGIAAALLQTALGCLDSSRPVIVTTFRSEDEKGAAPRALYRRFGFQEGRLFEELDYPVQELVMPPREE